MRPVAYASKPDLFEQRRASLNVALSFAGLTLTEAGDIEQNAPSRTLSEAEQRRESLVAELERRDVHPAVLRSCKAELLADNYFHALLEAVKGLAQSIREKSGLKSDGGTLVDQAFSLKNDGPRLSINDLSTESHESEHKGFANLLRGAFGMFRNPIAHAPRALWAVSERDAVDAFTLLSHLHRTLDRSEPNAAPRT